MFFVSAEMALVKFADLVRDAKSAFRVDFQYSESIARNAGALITRQEAKRQKQAESAKSSR